MTTAPPTTPTPAQSATTPPASEDEARIEYVDLDELLTWPSNPKEHNVEEIGRSIERFGFVAPGLVNEASGMLVAGHGRAKTLKALRERGATPPRRIRVDPDGRWLLPVIRGVRFNSDAEAEAYAVADNRLVELGGWNDELLAQVLTSAAATEAGLSGTGYVQADLDAIIARVNASDEEEDGTDGEVSDGSLLALTGVTFGDPRHTVTVGDRWRIGRHYLICGSVFSDWPIWTPYLATAGPGALFVPYPGVFIPLGTKAEDPTITLVMVQPSPFIAGHILDYYTNVHGSQSIERLNPTAATS